MISAVLQLSINNCIIFHYRVFDEFKQFSLKKEKMGHKGQFSAKISFFS